MNRLMSGRSILVVEDEMLVMMMIQMMLEELGCDSILAAASIDAALTCVAQKNFDIAMLDMNLGGYDSHQVADALDANHVPYLFCTGNVSEDRRVKVSEHLVLKKPFQFNALATALYTLLGELDAALPTS
ncbi:MAG: response regulator [Devosia sp.]